MAEPIVYPPLNTLKPVAPHIWIVDGPVVDLAGPPGLRAPFPTRMTVVKLSDGALWCHSPTAPDNGLFAALDAIGPVRHLVSPNKLHYSHIAAWKQQYPAALAWASPGVRERAASQHVDVAFDADLADMPPPAWAGDIDQLCFGGSAVMKEFVFFHGASRTLILADLIENFEAAKLPRLLRWMGKLGGVLDPDGKTPLDWRITFHKAEGRISLTRILAWHPLRVILAHGRCYMHDGEAELRRAFRWLG